MNYPIMLDLKGKKITIVGGGKVAYRKACNFINFGYKVEVVALEFIVEFNYINEKVNFIHAEYNELYIESSFLVIAATNNRKINESIGIFCREKGKLVNVVDNPSLSNFIVPSVLKRGDLIIGVSTSGKSPSLAAKIKKDLEMTYDDSYEEYVNLLGDIRSEILEKYDNPMEKKKLLNEIVNLNLDELKKYNI